MRSKREYLVYSLAGLFVTVWTLLRFTTHPGIYDLITQQLVARQWALGNFNPITLGTTHYVLKTIFLYIPMELMPGSPRLKLIILTLLVNFASFIIIAVLLRKILKEFKVELSFVPAAVLWLAMIAGSAFWISFTNSRNLEVAGGLYLVYCTLVSYKYKHPKQFVYMALFSGLLFFADTLQIYMTALPLVAYVYLAQRKQFYKIVATFCAGFILSKALFWLTSQLLNVTFSGGSIINGPIDIPGALRSTITLFAGSTDAGWVRVIANLLLITTFAGLFMYMLRNGKIPRKLGILAVCFVAGNESVYIFSGQAHQSHTSRYLIMLLPIVMLAIASMRPFFANKLTQCFIIAVVLINAATLGAAFTKHWDTSFSVDAHIHSVADYLNKHKDSYAYASMDTALPLSYYKEASATHMVALACAAPNLVKAKSIPVLKMTPDQMSKVPIIFDGNIIANSPAVCTVENVVAQLGKPISTDTTDDGSTVLYYPFKVLDGLGF